MTKEETAKLKARAKIARAEIELNNRKDKLKSQPKDEHPTKGQQPSPTQRLHIRMHLEGDHI